MPSLRMRRTILSLLTLCLSLLASSGEGAGISGSDSSSPTESAFQKESEVAINAAQAIAASELGRCFRVAPKYPTSALRNGQEGQTLVQFEVSADGIAQNPVTQTSSGFPLLDAAALNHMRRCIEQTAAETKGLLPAGRYALPMIWHIE